MPIPSEESMSLLSPVAQALSDDTIVGVPAKQDGVVAAALGTGLQETSRLEVARQSSSARKPEDAARSIKLSMQTGLPSEFIGQNVDEIEKAVSDSTFSAEQFRRQNPRFAAWLTKNPDHFALAKEDLGFFGKVEESGRAFMRGIESVPLMEEEAGLIFKKRSGQASASDLARLTEIEKKLQPGPNEGTLGFVGRQLGYGFSQQGSIIPKAAAGAMKYAPVGAGVFSMVPAVGTWAGAGLGARAGATDAMFRYSYMMETAGAYKAFKATTDVDGKPMDDESAWIAAQGVGVLNAAIETGSEYLLIKWIPGSEMLLRPGKAALVNQVKAALAKPTMRGAILAALKKMGAGAGVESAEEGVQNLTQALARETGQAISGQTFAPDSLAEDFKGSFKAAGAAFISQLGVGSVMHGAPTYFSEARNVRKALAAEQFALALGEGEKSKVFQLLPEKGQEVIREVAPDGLKTMYADPKTWTEYWQSKGLDPREVASEVTGDTTAYDDAISLKHDIAIPTERYARKLAVVPEHNGFWSQEVRHAPGEMNAREAREFFQKVEQENVEIAKEGEEFLTNEESAKRVKDVVAEQLKKAGVDDRVARTLAEVHQAFFGAMGKATGIDPMEMSKQFPLTISGPDEKVAGVQPQAKKSFTQRAFDAVRGMLGMGEQQSQAVTWKAIPSEKLKTGLEGRDFDYKERFSREAFKLIFDENGKDLLAEQLGIAGAESFGSVGAYSQKLNPNAVTLLPADTPIEKVNQYARAIQYIFRQDAVPFFSVRDTGGFEGFLFEFSRELTLAEQDQFFKDLRGVLTESAGYTKLLGKAIAVLNYDGIEGFIDKLTAFANSDERIASGSTFRADSQYDPVHDWKSDPQGEALKSEPSASGPLVAPWLVDRRQSFDALLRKEGWQPPGDGLTLSQPGPDGIRARLRVNGRQFEIQLTKDANLSSFLHETGHFFLEVLGHLSDDPKTNQSVKDDYATILAWLGAEKGKITTEQHEKFARGFEAYLMEGKAPSSQLRRAFARFKVWLTHIYRQIKALAVEVSPEVKRVFDRMLATEDAIKQAEGEQNISPLFDDPVKLLGVKDAQEYLDAVAEARAEADEELSLKVLAEVTREQEAWWKAERAKVREEIAATVDAQPVYKALGALTSRDPEAPQIKLDSQSINSMWVLREETRKNLPKGIASKEGGLHPHVVAEMFGFKDGYNLLDALGSAEPRRTLIDRLTDERMADIHGDLTVEIERMHGEAMKAVHNKKRAALLRRELEILAEKHMPELKGLTSRITQRRLSVTAVREMAESMILKKKIKDIDPRLYQRAESKAANEAVEAMLKGDFETAFDAKQREFLNHELFRAATEAREKVEKFLDKASKLDRADDKIAKNRDIDLVNAARAVLASFGIGRGADENAVSYLEQMARYDPDMHETVKVLVEKAQAVGKYTDGTYADFLYMKDTVDALWDLAKRTRQILVDGKLIEREDAMAEMENRLDEISKPGKRAGYDKAMTTWEKAQVGLMGMRSSLRRIESWVDAVDGGITSGAFRKYVWNPISEGATAYRVARRVYLEKYQQIVKGVEKGIKREDIKAPEIGYTFSGKAELLGAILHTGNESNFSKLLRGRGWGELDQEGNLDASRWNAMVARLQAEKVLTKEDYDYCQAVWDLLEEIKPLAQKAHKEMYGYYFSEVTARQFETAFGTYRGGYVPAVVDTFMATDAAIRQEREQIEKGDNSFMFPTSGRGFTRSRVERYAAPLMMDVRFIPGHIDKVLRFVHIEPRVKDVARIVMDRQFRKSLDAFDQTVGGDMLVPWLQRAAQQRIETPSKGFGGRAVDTLFRELRNRTGLQVMFANVANALQQPTGLSIAAVKVRPKYLRNALWQYVRQPSEIAKMVTDKSEFMATRETAKVIEIQAKIDDMMLDPTKYEKARAYARQHGYFLQAGMQNVVDLVVWSGAYDQATAEGQSEREAVRFADSSVRLTQGSFAAEDISRFEAGTPLVRAFSMFYGYFNMQANLLGSEFQTVAQGMGLKRGAGRLIYVYIFGFMIPAVLGDVIVKAAAGEPWGDDDDSYLDDIMAFFFSSQARTATAFFPGVGPAVQSGINAMNNKWYDDRITLSPAVSMIESAVGGNAANVYRAIQGKQVSHKKATRDLLTLLGLASGLPLAVISRPVGYMMDVSEGKAKPTGPVDYARGLITGRPVKR
jgi:tetratricopeptide (TPR) repeat protein